jgi:YD repeat-containing protein
LKSSPLLITKTTDPFGRSAELTYDGDGRLSSITLVLGLTSTFAYDSSSLIDAVTTPYGDQICLRRFCRHRRPDRPFLEITDPLGYREREETFEPAPIPDSDPPSEAAARKPRVVQLRGARELDLRGRLQRADGDRPGARRRPDAGDAVHL